jgi:hypothetical protein
MQTEGRSQFGSRFLRIQYTLIISVLLLLLLLLLQLFTNKLISLFGRKTPSQACKSYFFE